MAPSPSGNQPPGCPIQASIELIRIAECGKTKECSPAKHHYDECAERVTTAAEDADHKGPKEDCVEECKNSPRSQAIQHISEVMVD